MRMVKTVSCTGIVESRADDVVWQLVTYGIILADFLMLSSFVFTPSVIGDCMLTRWLGTLTLTRHQLGLHS